MELASRTYTLLTPDGLQSSVLRRAAESIASSHFAATRSFLATQIAELLRRHSQSLDAVHPVAKVCIREEDLLPFVDDAAVCMHLAGSFIEELRGTAPKTLVEELTLQVEGFFDDNDIVPDDTFTGFWKYDSQRYGGLEEIEVKLEYCRVFFRNIEWQKSRAAGQSCRALA